MSLEDVFHLEPHVLCLALFPQVFPEECPTEQTTGTRIPYWAETVSIMSDHIPFMFIAAVEMEEFFSLTLLKICRYLRILDYIDISTKATMT